MPSRLTLLRAAVASCSLLLFPSAIVRAQKFDTAELLRRGTTAYNALPANVTLLDAPKFGEALGYLYAYEQRMARANARVPAPTQAALGWMLSHMVDMSTGKSDGPPRSDEVLYDRGMKMYRKARASEEAGQRPGEKVLWDVPAFLSAATNLFAYLQLASSPRADAATAHEWLVQAQSRLVKSGGKGDDSRAPGRWLPGKRRPGAAAHSRDVQAGRNAARSPGTSGAASAARSRAP
jgi:hypothetical protein